jgi:hypothetical protein
MTEMDDIAMQLRARHVVTKAGLSRHLKVMKTTTTQQEFLLADLPADLRAALAGFDVDGNGSVTLSELAEGARLLRRTQEKVCPFNRLLSQYFCRGAPARPAWTRAARSRTSYSRGR